MFLFVHSIPSSSSETITRSKSSSNIGTGHFRFFGASDAASFAGIDGFAFDFSAVITNEVVVGVVDLSFLRCCI